MQTETTRTVINQRMRLVQRL